MELDEKATFYEIVELDSGEVALRRAEDQEAEPLVTIRFSDESKYHLDGASFEVAKIMIEAGLEAVAELNDGDDDQEGVHHTSENIH